MTTNGFPKMIHYGCNIRRFRAMFGIKQEALDLELEEDWMQKKWRKFKKSETF
jgi:hypothetical protein